MIEALIFLALCACLSSVHVLVTLRQRKPESILREISNHFIYLTGFIILLGGAIQGLSLAFQ
ncbi:MAG: hypothetical protein ACPG1Z_08755 [Planctomycetota bacterium]